MPENMARRPKRRMKISLRLSAKQKRWLRAAVAAGLMLAVGTLGWLRITEFLKSKHPAPAVPGIQTQRPAPVPLPPPQPLPPAPRRRSIGPGPLITFVIDDIGHTFKNRAALERLAGDVTFAILPYVAHSEYFSELGRQKNTEVILHLPLESAMGTIPGPGLITTRMDPDYIREQLDLDLRSVPYHVGVNNHMGSYGTAQADFMRIILQELKNRGLFFLDSQTTAQSEGPRIGKELGLPVLKRDVFLDNVDQPESIRGEFNRVRLIARKQGYAIAIGHDRENTLRILEEEIPKLKDEGFQIVSLSDLISRR